MLVIDDNEGINRVRYHGTLFNFFFIFSWKMEDAKKKKEEKIFLVH